MSEWVLEFGLRWLVVGFIVSVVLNIFLDRWRDRKRGARCDDARLYRHSVVTMTRFLTEAGLKVGDYVLWIDGVSDRSCRISVGGAVVTFVGGSISYVCPGGGWAGLMLPVDSRLVGIDDWRLTTLRRYVYAARARRYDCEN